MPFNNYNWSVSLWTFTANLPEVRLQLQLLVRLSVYLCVGVHCASVFVELETISKVCRRFRAECHSPNCPGAHTSRGRRHEFNAGDMQKLHPQLQEATTVVVVTLTQKRPNSINKALVRPGYYVFRLTPWNPSLSFFLSLWPTSREVSKHCKKR